MPPKKAGKDGPAKLADKENAGRAEAEVLGLQRLLELRSLEAVEARRSERLWRERMDAFGQALETQKEDTLDITADMLRQYKAMQEQLLTKVSNLEAENRKLKGTVGEKQSEIELLQLEVTTTKKTCDIQVVDYQRRMEDMQMDFTKMLRETLDLFAAKLAAAQGM
mmetsp:Transcript_4446/g.7394  ORF Transcript_4446/g.7394 Transcript_4446/m.7394 type:complete len:166 (+) Transcript_4446:66-563(+)|eukprot:CAMPEP_0119107652 /NCGR_PEP_ID=MMETSP1180-20130426/11523_1 /TAXON_ID=3052 ORGANISM="Chlamydomonas cf sp, Strain CCMP681" /NCGR_SAMPLE_ID=MMETSP1180 /ASSEMBLY_ACC=CAM_ASM_000741 /LENGTH=165 /DNA_ID=CAMNT_0007093169 /DNA_START=66 /DNA_END=563 /DNA_ORIENTATION=+